MGTTIRVEDRPAMRRHSSARMSWKNREEGVRTRKYYYGSKHGDTMILESPTRLFAAVLKKANA